MTPTPKTPTASPHPTRAEWRRRVESELGPGRDFERALVTRTLEGLPIAPLYTAEDAVRTTTGPLGGGWAITQCAAHPSPKVSNARLLEDLTGGGSGVSIAIDAATRGTCEFDTTRRDGVRLQWIGDLDRLLDGVYLDAVPIAFSSSANGLPLAAAFVALCRERGVDPSKVSVHIGMDPIAALARDGVLPGGLDDARRELCMLAHHSRIELGRARSLAVDASVWYRAGGHAVLELGYALASFVEVLRWLDESGLPPTAAHSEFVWRIAIGRDVFGEIAKLRAARELHARVLGSAGVEHATPLVIHASTSERDLATRDAWTNMLRTSLGAFAATAGGADLVTTLPFDAAIGDPSDLGRRNARNVQVVLEHESHLDQVGDPARGAYSVEARTDALARAAWALMRDIEAGGGFVAALRGGRVEDELAAARANLRDEIATRRRPILGVSEFPATDGEREPDAHVAPALDDADRERRIAARTRATLGSLDAFEHVVDAAVGGATLDEIGSGLQRAARESIKPLPSFREASVFEDLADAADRMHERPRVFLACLGPLEDHSARAAFATHLFHSGAFDVLQSPPDLDPAAIAVEFDRSEAAIACICGTNGAYELHAGEMLRVLGGCGARSILLARPVMDGDDVLRAGGLTGHVHQGCDAEALLRRLLELEGAVIPAPEVLA